MYNALTDFDIPYLTNGAGLPNLQELYLHDNKISQFEIPNPGLENLKILYLYNNNLLAFPRIASAIDTLEKLHLNNNTIENITMESVFGPSSQQHIVGSLTHLEIGWNTQMIYLNDKLWESMPKLKSLKIHNMNLKGFPNLEMLHDLTHLHAHGNNFVDLGNISKFMSLKKLTYVNLNNNDLKSLINFTKLAANCTSSKLDIYVKYNKFVCNQDLCWLKYLTK